MATPSLAGATAQAEQLQLKIAANAKRADILDERYLQARSAVRAAAAKIAATQAQIVATQASVDHLRGQLGGRAARLYMGAGSQDPIGMDVSSVQELGSRSKYGEAAAAEDLRVLHLLALTQAKLDTQHHDLDGQLAAAQDRQQAVQDSQREVQRANDSLKQLLDSTKNEIKLLAAKLEADSQAAAAVAEKAWLQRQAAREAARRRAAAKPGSVTAPDPGSGDPGSSDPGLGNLPAPSAGAWKAVQYVRAQLGKPYVYAGAGPDVFDCSGLTMMAWRQSGVSMEHGSRSQYMSFPHVPIDQLQPGDLVFFGDSGPMNHHVGMVVGPGLMIDAPHTGAFVELVSYFRDDLVPMGARP
ncbi:MAG TPA: NlpC/P60 family protein [Acidimicrobiia bacterium]|nr:NlpC/P60 family protein [Acidimicrobiia bacterium]